MTKTITLSPSGKTIPCEAGQTVLAALEKNGYVLPNNCRAGACGECKVRVLKGKFDQGFILDMALSQEEREQGLGLMCMAKLTSDDIEIQFANESAYPKLYSPQENLPFMVIEKSLVTSKIMKIKLRPLGANLKFWPGQFIQLGSLEKNIPYKSYSIANCPSIEGEILLFVTKVENGITSSWLHDNVVLGDEILVNGPYGTFVGNPQVELPVLCLANGSGLAPIMSLASAALIRGGFRYPATILFSAKKKSDLFEIGWFKYLEKKFRNFRFLATLTQESDEQYRIGRISELLPKLYPSLEYYSLYIAGSADFVEDCKQVALNLGAKEEQIYLESFLPAGR